MKPWFLMLLFALIFNAAHAQKCDTLAGKKVVYGTITVLTTGGASCWFVIRLVSPIDPLGTPYKEKLVEGCVPAEFTFETGVPVMATATDQTGLTAGSGTVTLTDEGERKTLVCDFR